MSINKFSADEVYEMAEQIERNGAAYYRKAAQAFENPNKDMLLQLAVMEDEHEKTFQELRSKLTGPEGKLATFDPNDDAVLYLQAMADGYVFDVKTQPADTLSGEEKLEDILKMALGMERDSIAFYVGLKAVTPDGSGKDKVEWIIQEEIRHVNLLAGKLSELGN